MGFIFLDGGWKRYCALLSIVAVAATSHFFQFKIIAAIVIAIWCGAPAFFTVTAGIAALVATYGLMLPHVNEIMVSSPNSGIRLAFLSDAISSLIDTAGVGIGFGKESVRWEYHFPHLPVFTFLADPRSMNHDRMLEALSTGVENSFAQAALRTGIPGFLILIASFLAGFPSRLLRPDHYVHAAVLFAVAIVACFVNSTLESPLAVVGLGFLYGYLVALNAYARAARGLPERFITQAPDGSIATPVATSLG
jgi:hypothetical protein